MMASLNNSSCFVMISIFVIYKWYNYHQMYFLFIFLLYINMKNLIVKYITHKTVNNYLKY